MFRLALRVVIRLLPFTAAMIASVAIGASTRATETSDTTPVQRTAHYPAPLVAMQSLRPADAMAFAAERIDMPLLARAGSLDLLTNAYPVESLDTALSAPAARVGPQIETGHGFRLPQRDRWTSLLATLALGAFFFLRRIV